MYGEVKDYTVCFKGYLVIFSISVELVLWVLYI